MLIFHVGSYIESGEGEGLNNVVFSGGMILFILIYH